MSAITHLASPAQARRGGASQWIVILAVIAFGIWPTSPSAATPAAVDTEKGVEFFESKVRPVLVDHCYPCHAASADPVRGGLLLDSRAGWEKGGASGHPALVPGDPDTSLLIRAVRQVDPDLSMPPKKKLADEEIAALETWVKLGAPDPRVGKIALVDPASRAAGHWAFQPVQSPTPPAVQHPAWARNPIDRFVLARLEENGMEPSPPADRRTLIRRASIVLTGLYPSAAEVAAFEADDSPDAFAEVVDRLLASPRYGERWARHWLDVARYADTKGYVFEEERRYPYAYTYRDYVIQAFNEDKPYDQFLVEQIAADQIVQGEDRSALAAMGFLTLGRRFLNNPHDIIDDRIDVVTRGTMALTVACARCHDHKYDPIPSADYYSLYGVFASSREPDEKPLLGTIPHPDQYAEFQAELAKRTRERDEFVQGKEEEYRQKLRQSVGTYLQAVHDAASLEDDGKAEELARSRQLSPLVLRRWREALSRSNALPEGLFAAWRAFADLPADGFAEAARTVAAGIASHPGVPHHPVVAQAFAGDPPPDLADVARRYDALFAKSEAPEIREFLAGSETPIALDTGELHRLFDVPSAQRKRALQRAIDGLQATHPGAPPRAMAMVDNDQPVEPAIFRRGNPGNRGPQVPRQFLALLAGPDRQPFTHGSGRLDLARAIASPDNPLTARVAVNRVWLHHFGAGLVRTPADFGLRSEPPSHPELLDWLASTFIRQGWSLKQLHRLILLSATWQQSSAVRREYQERDPDNRLLWRQNRRRLDFEATRDTLLQAAGRLDLTLGGHAVEITTDDYSLRRTVYGFVERQNLPGLFRTFDFATPDTSSAQRFQTTVPQQALFFMNSPFALDQARHLAERPEVVGAADPAERIRRLYEIVLQRPPQPDELALGQEFLERAADLRDAVPEGPAWQYGYGTLDREAEVVRDFQPLPHFTGSAWQGGPQLPDPKLGWLILNAEGGHPGSRQHGPVIRRWTAPADGLAGVTGSLRHPGEAGDGVRAMVVSSAHGILGQWQVHHGSVEVEVDRIRVARGDTLDFVVDCVDNENTDGFQWAPRVAFSEVPPAWSGAVRWDAREEFAGPTPIASPLTPWQRYAQVLLMANEAAFLD